MSIHEGPRAFKIELADSPAFQMQGTLWRVLATGDETGGIVGALDERVAHGLAAPMHSHEDADEMFYVLDGDVTFYISDKQINAAPGAFVYLPRYVHHGFQVESSEARVFNFVSPAGFEKLILDRGTAAKYDDGPIPLSIHDLPHPTGEVLEDMRKKYGMRVFMKAPS